MSDEIRAFTMNPDGRREMLWSDTAYRNLLNDNTELRDERDRLQKELAELRREMGAVWNYLKPNAANDMLWSDQIIISVVQIERERDELSRRVPPSEDLDLIARTPQEWHDNEFRVVGSEAERIVAALEKLLDRDDYFEITKTEGPDGIEYLSGECGFHHTLLDALEAAIEEQETTDE